MPVIINNEKKGHEFERKRRVFRGFGGRIDKNTLI